MSGVSFTEMLSATVLLCCGLPLSITLAVKANAPPCVGVPEIAPDEASDRPGGRLPEITLQVYPGNPPAAAKDWEYGVPKVAAARDEVETVRGVGGGVVATALEMMSVSAMNFCCGGLLLSFRVSPSENVPAAVGVPEITPLELSERPAGILPDANDHE